MTQKGYEHKMAIRNALKEYSKAKELSKKRALLQKKFSVLSLTERSTLLFTRKSLRH